MIHFETVPWLYAIIPAVAVLTLCFFLANRARTSALHLFASEKIIQSILTSYSPRRRRVKELLILLAAALLLVALARPQYGHEWRETKGRGIDILFALDVSRSMLAEDMQPNRLTRARIAVEDFVSRLDGDRIGLIAFAGDAFLQCPLTLDYNAFLRSLDALSPGIISRGGTDIAAAIETANAAFKQKQNYRILILLSDGEDLSDEGIKAAQAAAADGMRIFTVGIGSGGGAPIPIRNSSGQVEFVRDPDGAIVQSRLDAATLQAIANASGGFYLPLGNGRESLDTIYTDGLADIPRHELESSLQKIPLERFQWPLALAILCLAIEPLLGTRRLRRLQRKRQGAVTAVMLAAAFLLLPDPAQAASPKQAWQALRSGQTDHARDLYHQLNTQPDADPAHLYNEAVATYLSGQLEEARTLFTRTLPLADPQLQQRIHYNLGVIDYRLAAPMLEEQQLDPAIHSLQQAEKEFLNALDIRPADEQAQHNLTLTRQKLEQLEQLKQQQEQEQEQQQQQQSSEQQDPSQSEQSEQSESGDPSNSDSSDSSEQSESSEPSQDASGQQQDGEQQDQQQSGQDEAAESEGSDQGQQQEPGEQSESGESSQDTSDQQQDGGQQPDQPQQESAADQDPAGDDSSGQQPSPMEEPATDTADTSSAEETSGDPADESSEDTPTAGQEGTEDPGNEDSASEAASGQETADASSAEPERTAAMTREEARRMLEALSEQQRYLPFIPAHRDRTQPSDQRDW